MKPGPKGPSKYPWDKLDLDDTIRISVKNFSRNGINSVAEVGRRWARRHGKTFTTFKSGNFLLVRRVK